jgi:hypothetical protein
LRRGKFLRFGRRDSYDKRARGPWWKSLFKSGGSRFTQAARPSGGLKFGARGAIFSIPGADSPARALALGAFVLLLLFSASTATRRASLGNEVPWPAARPLKIFDSSAPANTSASPSTWARARLAPVQRGWRETFAAGPVLLGEWAHRLFPPEARAVRARDSKSSLGLSGVAWAIVALWIPIALWWGAATLLGWRRPSLGMGLLLPAQVLALLFWAVSMRAPVRPIAPASTCRAFGFGVKTVASGGLLSAQQQVDWHRARGFSGLAFSDEGTARQDIAALRRANPDMILLEGIERAEKGGRVAIVGQALSIQPRAWNGAAAAARIDAVEAWSNSVGDVGVAEAARSRGLAVVGSAGAGVGADCFVWTLLPAGVKTPQDVLRAVKSRRVAVGRALLREETPQNLAARAQAAQGPGNVVRAWREAASRLSKAQRLNVWAQVLALVALLAWWGARRESAPEELSGPKSAVSFLKRKRLWRRVGGLLAMATAFAGTIWIATSALGAASWKSALPQGWMFPMALLGWAVLDALYLLGRRAWKRAH